jgi:hypothetical protein
MRFSIYDENGELMRKLWDVESAESYIRHKEGWYYVEAKKQRKKKECLQSFLDQFEPAPF